jgi:ABC-type multidrug transport system fused ATPase/permease subunit
MSKLTVMRALTARFARRFIRLADLIVGTVAIVLVAGVWALAYFFSAWWWLLILPVLFLLGLYVIVRLIVAVVISQVHVGQLSKEQRTALDDFIDKVQQVLEARATPLPIIALICIKDIVVHRDLKTVRKIISETTGLRRDYQALEKLFN